VILVGGVVFFVGFFFLTAVSAGAWYFLARGNNANTTVAVADLPSASPALHKPKEAPARKEEPLARVEAPKKNPLDATPPAVPAARASLAKAPSTPAVSKPTAPQPGGRTPSAAPAAPVGAVSFREVKVNTAQVLRRILWAPDGKSFYLLEKTTGILRKIALEGFKEVLQLQLPKPSTWMTMSAEGIVVAAYFTHEVLVVDTEKLTVIRKISAPQVFAVASAPALSVAFAVCERIYTGREPLSVLDLKTGKTIRRYALGNLTTNPIGTEEPTVTPDGKYLFMRGATEQLHRFRIDGTALVYEESSARVARNGHAIEVSPDSKWVALPSGGGNHGAPEYSTLVYRVTNLTGAVATIQSGAYPRSLGFDPKMGYVYAHNSHQFLVFTNKGAKLKELPLPDGGEVRQFATHPDGGRFLLLTTNKLFEVVVCQP
jgi:hypothetical protein